MHLQVIYTDLLRLQLYNGGGQWHSNYLRINAYVLNRFGRVSVKRHPSFLIRIWVSLILDPAFVRFARHGSLKA